MVGLCSPFNMIVNRFQSSLFTLARLPFALNSWIIIFEFIFIAHRISIAIIAHHPSLLPPRMIPAQRALPICPIISDWFFLNCQSSSTSASSANLFIVLSGFNYGTIHWCGNYDENLVTLSHNFRGNAYDLKRLRVIHCKNNTASISTNNVNFMLSSNPI